MTGTSQERHRIIPVAKITELGNETAGIAELIPDINFCGFSAYIILLSSICKELGHSLPQSSLAGDCWSYVDGACSVIVGAQQIALPKHEPIANRLRGSSNIISGSQLVWLTAIGLGPIAFAAGVGNLFVQNLYKVAKTFRRMHDSEFWLEDTQNELAYIQQELRKIDEEIAQLRSEVDPAGTNRITDWLIKKKQDRSSDLLAKQLLLDSHIQSYNNFKANIDSSKSGLGAEQANYKKYMEEELAEGLYDCLMFGTAFVGMVLMCLPGTQLAAILLVSVAVSLFLYKHKPSFGKEFDSFTNLVNSKAEQSFKFKDDDEGDSEGESTVFASDDQDSEGEGSIFGDDESDDESSDDRDSTSLKN